MYQSSFIDLVADINISCEEVKAENLSILDKKALNILQCMDFSVFSVRDENEQTIYILYDIQNQEYRDYFPASLMSFEKNTLEIEVGSFYDAVLKNFISGYDISYLLSYLADDYFTDYGFDMEKCFNEDILDFKECLLPEDE